MRQDDWGERPLAYPIDRAGQRRVPPAPVPRRPTRRCSSGLDRTLRITDGVLRFRIIKLAPGTPERARHDAPRRRETPEAARRRGPRRAASPPRAGGSAAEPAAEPAAPAERRRGAAHAAEAPAAEAAARRRRAPQLRASAAAPPRRRRASTLARPLIRRRRRNNICAAAMGWAEDMSDGTVRRTDVLRASPPMFESRVARRALARAPRGARAHLRAGDRRCWSPGACRRRACRVAIGLIARRLRAVDAVRVLAAPARLPLRARGRDRRAAALDHPRRPPRPPQRPAAPGDAARREHPAGGRGVRGDLPDLRRTTTRPGSARASSPATWSTT